MIELKDVSKVYGRIQALDNVSMSIEKGGITGFIGPNGAGKTTVMNIISGCIGMTSGRCVIDGADITAGKEVRKKIGYLPEIPPLYGAFSVYEYLSCMFDIKGIKLDKKRHILEIAEKTGISEALDRSCKNLSKGYKQRTGIAYAMIGYPDYIILDEPTSGLDPKQKHDMLNFIKDIKKDCGILLSSHILSEIDAVCDKIIMIDKGKIVRTAQKTVEQGALRYEYRIRGAAAGVMSVLKSCRGIISANRIGEDLYVIEMSESGMENLFYTLAENRLLILSQRPYKRNIEEIFLEAVDGGEKGKKT